MRVGIHPIEMSDVAIGAVDALARESREPTAACRVEIGNDVDIARAQTLFRSVKSTLVCRGRREVQQSRGGSGARRFAVGRILAEGESSKELRSFIGSSIARTAIRDRVSGSPAGRSNKTRNSHWKRS